MSYRDEVIEAMGARQRDSIMGGRTHQEILNDMLDALIEKLEQPSDEMEKAGSAALRNVGVDNVIDKHDSPACFIAMLKPLKGSK